MSTPTLTRAAELLECEAAELLCFAGPDGDWAGEPEAREAHDEMLAVAAELRAMLAAATQPPAVEALKAAVEGECDGLAISDEQARAILAHVLRDLPPAAPEGASPTAGMTLWQRIEHVGGRINAASYVEFGSVMAVDALISHVLRDLPPAPAEAAQPADVARLVDERTAFEAWFCKDGDYEPERLHGRKTAAGFWYSDADTENMWQAWQARAALAAKGGA